MSPLPLPPLRIGLAGWHHPHWVRSVYPHPRPKNFHPLEHLARLFDVIEINTTFYQAIRPEVARLWLHKTARNADFRFTAKLNRRFTHERVLDAAEIDAFRNGLTPLQQERRLGCLLMQFPWSFRFTSENREFFIRLRRAFHDFPLVAEMRHSSWMCDEALGTFIDYHVGFANIDQPEHVKAMPPTAFLTSPVGYVRLHGRNKDHWFQEYSRPAERGNRYNYLYSAAELREWQPRVDRIRAFSSETFIVFNNDAEGKSVVNALQMQAMLGGQKRIAPHGLTARFAEALTGFVEKPKQESLFELGPVRSAVA